MLIFNELKNKQLGWVIMGVILGLAWLGVVLCFLAVTAGYCSELAENKKRSPGMWWVFGFFLGPLAMAVLWMSPLPKDSPSKEHDFKLEEL
ncbi:hypothetical protein LWC08_01355 [Desulfobaculum bizertense]|uniref:hypothetical protein n=1 Tax=Desulfobaculum bizertense TaxID=376490 RepID=UPI001F3280A7|nr:hypothetical protein [Desulfobaculum bizertense]UIJ38234.1 hypothetical protein LWC08_01355 [Desulfobaculum bizertense]